MTQAKNSNPPIPNPVDLWIGKRLKERRRQLRLSLLDLGNMLGITLQQVHKYEAGSTRVSGSRLFDIACVLNVSVNYFFMDIPQSVGTQSPGHLKGTIAGATPRDRGAGHYAGLVDALERIPSEELRDLIRQLLSALALEQKVDGCYQNGEPACLSLPDGGT